MMFNFSKSENFQDYPYHNYFCYSCHDYFHHNWDRAIKRRLLRAPWRWDMDDHEFPLEIVDMGAYSHEYDNISGYTLPMLIYAVK